MVATGMLQLGAGALQKGGLIRPVDCPDQVWAFRATSEFSCVRVRCEVRGVGNVDAL